MSFEAVNWAFAQEVGKSSTKFILVAMAKLAGSDMRCWPSSRHLANATEQDLKTVQAGIKRLRDGGFIEDTGERRGETGQVIVYLLKTPKTGGVSRPDNTPENGGASLEETPPNFPSNESGNGVVTVDSKTPVFPVKDPRFSAKDPQISRQRPPKTGDGQVNDKSDKSEEREDSAPDLFGGLLNGVDPQVLTDYLKVRKAKKGGPLTQTAIEGIAREAAKAAVSVESALRVCCERSWVGFKADWHANTNRGPNPSAPRPQPVEPDWRREQRERMQRAAPYAAARREPKPTTEVLDALPHAPR